MRVDYSLNMDDEMKLELGILGEILAKYGKTKLHEQWMKIYLKDFMFFIELTTSTLLIKLVNLSVPLINC